MRSQGVTEELKCLSLLNALDKDQDIPDQLAQLFGEPCIKLAEGIKAYISKVRNKIKNYITNIQNKYSTCRVSFYISVFVMEIPENIITEYRQ